MPLRILITGTPGTGKTTLTETLTQKCRNLGKTCSIVLVNDLIKSHRLYDEYDKHFDTYIIDDKKVRKFLESHLNSLPEDIILMETHTVTTIPKNAIDLVFVLTCRTDVLFDRLTARNYSKDKIDENMECEIMRIVLEEAVDRFGPKKVVELMSNTNEDLEDNIDTIITDHLTRNHC